LLEGLNVGSIDVGFVGEAPPIFAQAAGAQFVYIGYEPAAPEAEGLVVPKASPLKTVADLKGRKVALNRGSNVHYLLLKLLEKAGLAYSDIQPVFLPPADARAAFERGAVDAWLVWDPSWRRPSSRSARASWPMAGRGVQLPVLPGRAPLRAAAPGGHPGPVRGHGAAGPLDQDPSGRSRQVDRALQGLDVGIVRESLHRYQFNVQPVTPAVAAEQQKVADAFAQLKLIPKPIRVADALPSAKAP
jgi:sulfonate transport system substrate-binding protein